MAYVPQGKKLNIIEKWVIKINVMIFCIFLLMFLLSVFATFSPQQNSMVLRFLPRRTYVIVWNKYFWITYSLVVIFGLSLPILDSKETKKLQIFIAEKWPKLVVISCYVIKSLPTLVLYLTAICNMWYPFPFFLCVMTGFLVYVMAWHLICGLSMLWLLMCWYYKGLRATALLLTLPS